MKKFSVFLSLAAIAFLSQNQANAVTIIGLTNNSLVSFDSSTPGTTTSPVTITGLNGDVLRAIDFRPADKQLYGLGVVGSTGTVYRIDPVAGTATSILNGLTISSGGGGGGGFPVGFDFNPVSDALRIVNRNTNLRITGNLTTINTDANPNPGNPNVVGAAYTNNFAGAALTTLYDITAGGGGPTQLFTQGSLNGSPVSPNTGTLFDIGALGVSSGGRVGFDITSDNQAFASLTVPPGPTTPATLYSIDLGTGVATSIGAISENLQIEGIAVVPVAVPEPNNSFGLLGAGLLGLLSYGWRRQKDI